jgi:hypothetical protein
MTTPAIETIFDAVPDRLLSNKNQLFQKSRQRNLFYIILGYKSLVTNEYFVNYYVLCKTKSSQKINIIKKKHGLKVFKSKTKVMEFIYDFLDNFSHHERILNTFSTPSKTLHYDIMVEDITAWVEKIISIFYEYAD